MKVGMLPVWVVEMKWEYRWHPTVGARLNKQDGMEELAGWKKRNPSEKFRLTKYLPAPPKEPK